MKRAPLPWPSEPHSAFPGRIKTQRWIPPSGTMATAPRVNGRAALRTEFKRIIREEGRSEIGDRMRGGACGTSRRRGSCASQTYSLPGTIFPNSWLAAPASASARGLLFHTCLDTIDVSGFPLSYWSIFLCPCVGRRESRGSLRSRRLFPWWL